jgi:geranylgeranyl pyrophosphate synthase
MTREEVAIQVEAQLHTFFAQYLRQLPPTPVAAQEMVGILRDFCLGGGKRLRPYLVVCAHELVTDQGHPALYPLAAITELLHAFLLIHDDIMDRSDLRRGRPTVHKHYEEKALAAGASPEQAQQQGLSLAILAGDLCHTFIFRLVSQLPLADATRAELLHYLGDGIARTIFGQDADVRFETAASVSSAEIIEMYSLKTASYTFDLPLQLGARLAGTSPETLERLHEYALACGIAFQLQDDLLGLFGDPNVTGKAVGADIEQGKKTLLLTLALELAGPSDRATLQNILGKPYLTEAELSKAQRIVQASGAEKACEQIAHEHQKQAQKILAELLGQGCRATAVANLRALSSFVMERVH